MKKILYFLALLLGIFTMVSLTSCNHRHKSVDGVRPDSATIAVIANEVFNPEFESVIAFVDYAREETRYNDFINIVKSLDPHTVGFVASEVLSQNRRLNWDSWLDEYNTNAERYRSLDRTNKLGLGDNFHEYEHLEVPPRKEDTICVH